MNITVKFWQFLILIGIITLAFAKIRKDNNRLSDNFDALAKGTEYFRINDSISERLLLDNAQIKEYFPEIKAAVEQMNVKMRQLERYSAVSSAANYQLANRLQDTVIIIQSPPLGDLGGALGDLGGFIADTVKIHYIRYSDEWIDFFQTIVADSAHTSIQTRDSIAIVQSWTRPNKFLFVRWGRKNHIQTVTNANPHATITYSVYVEKR